MRIKWCGTASLIIEGGATRVIVDPYFRRYNKKLAPFPMEEARTADAVFITHPHPDHFPDARTLSDDCGMPVYVSENGIQLAKKYGVYSRNMVALGAGETVSVGDITVRTFKSAHCKFDAATILGIACKPATYLHARTAVTLLKSLKNYKLQGDIYALEISCGDKKIMVLGSAGIDENTVYPQGADLLVFPYQGRARMHKVMLPFLKIFRPKAVMADHFDNAFPPLTHTVNTKRFIPAVKSVLPEAEAILPDEGEWYEI